MLTFDLAHSIMRFMEARSEAREAYLLTCRRLEQARGSQLYSDGVKAAADKRAATVREAQHRARAEATAIFEKMRKNASSISASPPSADQLALLEVLKMRETIDREELDEAAAAMAGCSMGLAVIDDLAAKNRLFSNYAQTMSTKLSRATAEAMINEVERNINKMLADEIGATPAAAQYAEYRKMMYGESTDPDSLPQVQPYPDEFAFLEAVGIEDFDKFSAAVG